MPDVNDVNGFTKYYNPFFSLLIQIFMWCKTMLISRDIIYNSLYCFIDKCVADSGLFTFLATLDLFIFHLPVCSCGSANRLIA